MGYIEKTYGRSEKFLAFKVCFYDTFVLAREYKSGYAADRFARKCAAQGLWCSLHGLAVTDDATVAYISTLDGGREERAFELAKRDYYGFLDYKEDRYTTVYGYMD